MPAATARDGQYLRPIEAARQTLRQQEQRGARDAAEEMRRLDDAERQEAIEQRQAPLRGRRRTGEQQHDARRGR